MTRLRPVVHYPWLALALILAGCGGRGDGPIDLRLWAMGREGEMVERLLPAFHARHPGVRVRVQQVPWSAAHEKLLTAYVGDAMPDVFQVGTTWIAELVALGAVAPLDQRLATAPALRDDAFAGIAAANAVAGVAYAVPWYVDTRLLFYRTDRLRAAGYEAPPADWATWAAAMTAVRDQAGAGNYALLLPVSEWQPPVILALQRGAGLLRDGDRYGDFQSPAFRAAFAFYLSLFADGLAPAAAEGQVANLYQDFARGFFSFYVTGPWNIGEFAARLPAELAGAWSTAPMPGPEPGQPGLSIAGGASLAISPSSPHADAAWKLITYLADPATQVEFYRLTGDLPARPSAWHAAQLTEDRYARAFWEQLQHLRAPPQVPEWERIAGKISQYAEAAVRGDLSADAALAGLDRDVDAILEKRRWLLARRSEEAP